MMDRWMRETEGMMRNTVEAKLGRDITIDFIVIKGGRGTGILLMRETMRERPHWLDAFWLL